eukprot:TRINITY_DN2553_c0_g1_i13.p1 TRINITY_DN2553_c0_g1~~TRINITY_DN2553_c0_g1_i13.p1  ORF type:complete len:154 (+),score=11.72 TRINITY_DN2553_c0_g1_i13:411-872(+)
MNQDQLYKFLEFVGRVKQHCLYKLCVRLVSNMMSHILPIHKAHTPCDLLKETINKCIRNGSKYIFIDEIQRVDDWPSVLLAFEYYDVQFVVAGSQASAFRSNTLLVGRHIDIHVMPYSFKEFKCALEQVPTEKKKNLFSLYLTWGGFPKLLEI